MLAILSPAKSIDSTPVSSGADRTVHVFSAESAELLAQLKALTPGDLRSLMGISESLAELNHERHQGLSIPVPERALAAAHLFDGDVYKGLDARSLSEEDLVWSQDRVAILSGLYGLLRPLDRTAPYRLEMGTRLVTDRGPNLYRFWGDRLAHRVDELVKGHVDPVIVDLASKEYSRAVPRRATQAPWLTVQFKEVRGGKARVISFFAKRARGLMARHIIENRIETREGLKSFTAEGYGFEPELSSDTTWVFTRSSA